MRRSQFLNSAGLRKDGRRAHEIRRIRCKFGVSGDADGSVLYEQGLTRVLALVQGPREATFRQEVVDGEASISCEYRTTPFSSSEHRTRRRGMDRKSVDLAKTVKRSMEAVVLCERYPRSQIRISLYGIRSDGGMLCACINATTLALIDAGVPMKDYVVACSAGCFEKNFLTDLNYLESSSGKPNLPVAMIMRSKRIVMSRLKCKLEIEKFEGLLESAQKGCKNVHEILKSAVKERAAQVLQGHGDVESSAASMD